MLESYVYAIQVTSALSVVLPISVGLWKWKSFEGITKWFILFLFVDFAVDLLGWFIYLSGTKTIKNGDVQSIFVLFEALFFLWFINKASSGYIIKFICQWSWVILVPFWSVCFFYGSDVVTMTLFRTTAEIIIAFAASFSILQMIENESNNSHQLAFWILQGIFLFCFCTFFITAIQIRKSWYLHNIFNIARNLLYFYGFLTARKMYENSYGKSESGHEN